MVSPFPPYCPAEGVTGPAGNRYQFQQQPRYPRHGADGLSTPTAGAQAAQRWSKWHHLHPRRAPGHARPLGTHLPKPALNEGREGDRHRKPLSTGARRQGTAAFGAGAQACSLGRATHTTILGDAPYGAVRFLSSFRNAEVACYRYRWCHSHIPTIRGNPSRPVRLFWCNEQPSCLIFQKWDAALTSPSLCCAQPRRWWLNARLVGLSCSSLSPTIHAGVDAHGYTHMRVYNCPPQFSSETVFFPVGSSLPISVSECTDTQPFTSQAGESAQPHFHGAHVAPWFAQVSGMQTVPLFLYSAATITSQTTLLTGLVSRWV